MLWKIPLGVVGAASGLVLLLLVAVGCVLYVQPVRQAVIAKALPVVEQQTGLDIDVGDIYLSPFHHSPLVFYRAYKGKADLPLEIALDSVFVGHRGVDTLLYARSLRLRATAKTSGFSFQHSDPLALPIKVEQLRLEQATFHSDSLIAAVGIDAIVGLLDVHSPELIIAEGQYPLHGLKLYDSYVGIDLRETPPDTTANDTTPMKMAFDVPDGDIRNLHFALTPMDMHVRTKSLFANVLADVGANRYDARRLDIGALRFGLGNLDIPADTIYGNACVDLATNQIQSDGLHVRSSALGASADLQATEMNLGTMRVDVIGDAEYQGSQAHLRAMYDIDDEAYDAHVDIERVNLAPFLKDSTPIVLAGTIDAKGQGIDIQSRAMRSHVQVHLTDAIYGDINVSGLQLDATLADKAVRGDLRLPVTMKGDGLKVKGQTAHRFHVADFLTPEQMAIDYKGQLRNVQAHVAGEDFAADRIDVAFATDTLTSLKVASQGLDVDFQTPMHVLAFVDRLQPLLTRVNDSTVVNAITSLQDLSMIDTLRHYIPDLQTVISLRHGSPAQQLLERRGMDINEINLTLHSDSLRTDLALDASIPDIDHPNDSTALRLPDARTALRVGLEEGKTTASLTAGTSMTDGVMSVDGLCTDAGLRLDVTREGQQINGKGRLTLDSLAYQAMELGNRAIDIAISPSEDYDHALRVDVRTEEIPLDIVQTIVELPDIALRGMVKARASIDGLPAKTDISADVLPMGVSAEYTPYQVGASLGQTPIVMEHNHIDLNGLPIYGADSTFIALTGGLDLDSMQMNVVLKADSFAPVKLPKDGPLPVYGDLATDIRGTVTGSLDSIIADVDVTLLPTTDITYPISKKNLAQVKPYGTVNVRYNTGDTTSNALALGGQINVDNGFVRYSPKAYPIMPFHVDSGSHITFHGPVGKTELAVSASQQVKADVESEGEETRRVDFRTGVRVKGEVDSIGLNSIDFFLEAPEDETITRELASLDEDTREGLAATLLATGMYVGESNVAQHRDGYALSSIINSRINAALANSKVGKWVEIDFSSAQTEHAGGKTNDMNIAISKSFFKNKLRVTVGSTLTDNPEVNKTSGLLSNLSAEYKLTKEGNVLLRLFADRDYNNVLEGELYKAGLGVRAWQDWKRRYAFRGDSINRTHRLTADAGVAYRSNNSIGPDVTLKYSLSNLLGRGETFNLKGNGAYYWALRNRHPGDPKKTDTYKLGLNASLIFPYLHWVGENNPDGDTRYMLGYQYENIAGGYGVHKLSGSFTYFIHSSRFITHAFTPFSLSVVLMKAESDSLWDKAAEMPDLIKVIAGDEFVPSIGYTFTYNDYRSKRAVNTLFEVGVKESGNLINALYCLAGHQWNEKEKKLGSITFNQFVKMNIELRNKFNFTDKVCIATRLFAGANMPLGNSYAAPLSEAFYAGGPNGMRAASPYAYGPGNFYSEKFNQNFFHAGDVKLEANFELRFPIVWKLFGAAFLDAGNVWNWYSAGKEFEKYGYTDYIEKLQLREELYDGLLDNPYLAKQIALGTGAGLRLDLDGLVIRLDLGVAIHSPFLTYKYKPFDKEKGWEPDPTKPINTYYNIPSALDGLRVNFGIGYPF